MKYQFYSLLLFTVMASIGCKKDLLQTQPQTIEDHVVHSFASPTNFNVTFPGFSYSAISSYVDKGYVIAGTIGDNAKPHVGLVKIDKQGQKVWEKTIAGSGMEQARVIVATQDSAYFIAGATSSRDGDFAALSCIAPGSINFIMKIDLCGKIIWVKNFDPIQAYSTQIQSIIETHDNNYLVIEGQIIKKIDQDGKVLWSRTININGFISKGAQDKNGDYVLTGTLYTATRASDFLLLKMDEHGTVLWQKLFGGSGQESSYDITIDGDNNYISAGYTYSNDGDVMGQNPSISEGGLVLKTDQNGNKLWAKVFGGSANDDLRGITTLSNGQYLAAGFSDIVIPGTYQGWLLKINADGTLNSNQTFLAPESIAGQFFYVEKGDGNNYIAGGLSAQSSASQYYAWVVSIPCP